MARSCIKVWLVWMAAAVVGALACGEGVRAQERAAPNQSPAHVRIKDITDLEGARGNYLIGVGLVVGLENTGARSIATRQMAVNMLQKFNMVDVIQQTGRADSVFQSGNISRVMVTTELGPFARRGSKIDALVSVLDDGTSLRGGVLLMTELKGADKVTYAVAQGPLTVGGFRFTTPGSPEISPTAMIQVNHPTVGRLEKGAIVEREARGEIVCNGQIRLLLRDPDYVTARDIAKVVNAKHPDSAFVLDGGTVNVLLPEDTGPDVSSFVADVGLMKVKPDAPAVVVINERTGTIVAGGDIKVDSVAVAHGNLIIAEITEAEVPEFPIPGLAEVEVEEQKGHLKVVPASASVTVAKLASALNRLGATPRDLIAIFQALRKSGALRAELIIM